MAKLARDSERYEDMEDYIVRVASMGTELTPEEKNLLWVAFKNSVGVRRSAWRAVNQLETRESSKGEHVMDMIKRYREKVVEELRKKCTKIIEILDADHIPLASKPETKIFYIKMRADYARYLAEFTTGQEHGKWAEEAHGSYKQGTEIAFSELPKTHPTRLGLALNFSVFYYEIHGSPQRACLEAKAAFDAAIQEMDNPEIDEETMKDSSTIMQLLRDNLQLWTSDMQEDKRHGEGGQAM